MTKRRGILIDAPDLLNGVNDVALSLLLQI